MFSIYTLSPLGDSSRLIGSLVTVSSDYDVIFTAQGDECKVKIIAVVNWVFCQSFRVRTFCKYKNILAKLVLQGNPEFTKQ